jgi:hypothetical protein
MRNTRMGAVHVRFYFDLHDRVEDHAE